MTDFDGTVYTAKYSTFKVGLEDDDYRLDLSGYDPDGSTLLDAFNWPSCSGRQPGSTTPFQNGARFSTRDRPGTAVNTNTGNNGKSCASEYKSGKWANVMKLSSNDAHSFLYICKK